MARQRMKASYLKPRSDLLVIYFAAFFVPVAIVLSIIEPQYVALWIEVELGMFFLGGLLAGIWAYLRQRTEKLATGSQTFELAWDKPVTLEVQQYTMDGSEAEDLAQQVPDLGVDEIRDLAKAVPGYSKGDGGRMWPVNVLAYLPGGIKASFYISPHPGAQGVVIVEGEHETIDFDWGKVLPYEMHLVDPSHIPTEVKTKIAALHNPNLKPGEHAWWRTGDLHPGMIKFLQTNPLAHAVVLQHLKVDGVANAIYRRIVDKLEVGTPLWTELTNGKEKAFREAFTAAVSGWLDKQEPLKVSLGRGFAGLDYKNQRIYAMQATINRLEAENELYADKSYDEVRQKRAEAAHTLRVYSQPQPTDPGADRANRRDMRSADGMEPY
jgi:hypothetical protein